MVRLQCIVKMSLMDIVSMVHGREKYTLRCKEVRSVRHVEIVVNDFVIRRVRFNMRNKE